MIRCNGISSIQLIHSFNELMYFCISFVTWIHLLHEFHYFCLLHEFTYVCLYELLGVDTMAPKEAKKRMKASEHRNVSYCKQLWDQLLIKLYHIEHHQLDWNVKCKLWYFLATTAFSTFRPKAILIIPVIHVWNQKPSFLARVIVGLVNLIFWHFYQMLMSHQHRLPK